MRRTIIWFTLFCFVTTQTAAVADPHDEGTAAGQAANPVIRATINTPSATATVPGYTTTPPETTYYGQPNLSGAANTRLTACAGTPNDPACQAQRGALSSANTPRPAVGANDPAVTSARAITRSPSSVLDDLASYYSGCATSTTGLPASTQTRTCLRYQGVGNYSCSRTLSVGIARSTNCTPGDWFAHATSGSAGLDVQCVPGRPDTAQHFRVTQDGSPLSFFNVDMTTPVVFPQMVALLADNDTGIWVADKSCTATTCSLTAMIAPQARQTCTGGGDSSDITCTTIEPFLKRYAACRAGTQSGDNIDRKSTRLNSSHIQKSRMPSSA